MGGSESAPSTPRNEVKTVTLIDNSGPSLFESVLKTRSITRITASVPNSVHNGRTFVRSREPVNIRFPNCGVNNGNMNCYGAVFESGTRVVTYHDDNTNAEYFYIWMEQSSDMEFMLSPTSNTDLFVNIEGGMVNNAKLMLYRKNGRCVSNLSTVEIDPNELWYTECTNENGKWKYYMRATPDNSGNGNFYLKCNNEAEGISTTTTKQNNCNFIIIDASNDNDLDMPINIHSNHQVMTKNIITIRDYGTHKFQESKEWFNLLSMDNKNYINTNGQFSSSGSKLKFRVLRDFYNRYLLRTTDNKYVDLKNQKLVTEADQNCLFYTSSPLFGFEETLHRTSNDEIFISDVKFAKHMTLDSMGLGVEGVFQDGSSFTAESANEKEYTLSQVKFDINSVKEQHNLQYTEQPKKDKITFPLQKDRSVPTEQYFEFNFEGKTHVVFNWYKWILETVKPLENKDSYPLLAALYDFCENGIVSGNTNKTYFGIDFVAEGASDDKRAGCIGWNRYRTGQLTDEMCYLKHVLSFAIQSYITDNIGKQPSGHSLESIIKSLFIKNNLLLKHNLAGLTYFRLMEIFGVTESSIKNVIPHIDKNISLPIWDHNLNPFTTDTNEMTDYKVIDNDISNIVSDRQNPFIFINATKDRTINVADKNTSLNALSESVNGLVYNNIFENETTVIPKDGELTGKNAFLHYNGKIKIGKRDAGVFVKREINSSGSVRADIKFNIKVKWIGTGGSSPRVGSKVFGSEPGGTHAEFCVPESITVDEKSWNSNLPRSWIKELNDALAHNSIHIEWSSNYGGCYGSKWSLIGPAEKVVVNGHTVMGKSAGDGYYCNQVFGGPLWCGADGKFNRNHVYLKINLKRMKQRLEELCKERTATIVPNQSSMNFNTHFCKPGDFNTLRGLYHYKHYHNEEFGNGWVWLWARITNWDNCYGNDNNNILNQAVHDCVKEGRDGSFTITIEDKDDTQGNMYATNYKPIKDKGINNLSEQEIYGYIEANQLCQNLPPADKYKYESFQCKLVTDKLIRLFDDRFDKVIMNTLTNQSNLSKITSRFGDEVRKIVDSKLIDDKLKYASLADGFVNKINVRYSIESPLYPAAAIVDYSLMKKAGVYSPDENQVAFGDQNKLVINDKENTNLSKLFEVIASSLADNDLLVRTTTEDGKELYSAPGFIVIKLQTGCGHLLNLFNQYDPAKGFVTVSSCARTDLTHHLSNDTSSVYFVLEPILKDDPYKEDDTMTSANELQIVKTSYPIRIIEKTSTQFSFIDQNFRIYYKDASTRADDNEAMTETTVTMLNKSITGIEAEALKYDYRITKRFGTQSIKVASFMTKYDGSEVIDMF